MNSLVIQFQPFNLLASITPLECEKVVLVGFGPSTSSKREWVSCLVLKFNPVKTGQPEKLIYKGNALVPAKIHFGSVSPRDKTKQINVRSPYSRPKNAPLREITVTIIGVSITNSASSFFPPLSAKGHLSGKIKLN